MLFFSITILYLIDKYPSNMNNVEKNFDIRDIVEEEYDKARVLNVPHNQVQAVEDNIIGLTGHNTTMWIGYTSTSLNDRCVKCFTSSKNSPHSKSTHTFIQISTDTQEAVQNTATNKHMFNCSKSQGIMPCSTHQHKV